MNTKLLMASSAILMGIAGVSLLFLPDEILSISGYSTGGLNSIALQIFGALYIAFCVLNWLARANLIGGIYSKPVALANFAHFFIGGLSLLKGAAVAEFPALWVIGMIYSVFAVLFAVIAFGNPLKEQA